MTRIAIEMLTRRLNAAYRDDPFHALRRNVESVRLAEWHVRAATWSVDEFGTQPELSISELVMHVAGAKLMYVDRIFGEAKLEWTDIQAPSHDMQPLLGWLDENHRALANGLAALTDDAELTVERPAPWRTPMQREQLLSIVINHDLYHAGEINRQRALIRGAEGWERTDS